MRHIRKFIFPLLVLFCLPAKMLPGVNIDSLLNVLKTAKDTARVNTLINLASAYAQEGDEKALTYIAEISNYAEKEKSDKHKGRACHLRAQYHYSRRELKESIDEYNKAVTFFKMCGDKKELGKALNNLGLAQNEFGQVDRAIESFEEGIKIRTELKDSAGISKMLNNLGMACMEKGEYNKSIEYLQRSISIDLKLGHIRGLGTSYTNLGNTYGTINQRMEALSCYKKALEYFLKIDDKRRIGNSYNNIGTVYQNLKKYDEAEEYHKKALEIRLQIKDEKGLASSYTNLGIVENYKGNYIGALPFLEKALVLKEKFGDKFSTINTLNSLSDANLKLFRVPVAEKHVKRAIQMAIDIKAPGQLKDLYIRAAEVSEAKGDMKSALMYIRRSNDIKDSLFQIESYKKIAEMEARFHNEEKQKENELLRAENQIQEVQNSRKTMVVWIVSIAAVLSLVLGVLAIRGNIQKRKANLDLENKNREVNEKNNEITLQKHIIEEKNKDILDSIQYAKRIQEGILPDVELFKAFLPDSFILFLPKDIVSGDFYWCEPIKANKAKGRELDTTHATPALLFAACDCTGHGVPGAFVTFLGYNALNRCVNEFGLTRPAEILDEMNMLVDETFSRSSVTVNDGMDISLCYLQVSDDGESAVLEYAGANNPLYIIRKGGAAVEVFQPDNQPIGRHITKKSFTNHKIALKKGDLVFLFSDGFADQFGGSKGKKLKYSRFREILLECKDKPMESVGEELKKVFASWKGNLEQVDDICVIGVRV
jgi:tetratricopeptide (TPR) repeat protein